MTFHMQFFQIEIYGNAVDFIIKWFCRMLRWQQFSCILCGSFGGRNKNSQKVIYHNNYALLHLTTVGFDVGTMMEFICWARWMLVYGYVRSDKFVSSLWRWWRWWWGVVATFCRHPFWWACEGTHNYVVMKLKTPISVYIVGHQFDFHMTKLWLTRAKTRVRWLTQETAFSIQQEKRNKINFKWQKNAFKVHSNVA